MFFNIFFGGTLQRSVQIGHIAENGKAHATKENLCYQRKPDGFFGGTCGSNVPPFCGMCRRARRDADVVVC